MSDEREPRREHDVRWNPTSPSGWVEQTRRSLKSARRDVGLHLLRYFFL